MPHRLPHPFAPPHPGGTPLAELIDRHAHLVAVGLANCRAAQALHKEITRRQREQQAHQLETKNSKLETRKPEPETLANEDDHYNPLERRDSDGKWTTGPNASGTNSSTNASVAAQVKGSPLKFGYGFNEALQRIASSIGQGMAQLSDPGPLKDNFSTFLRAQDQALATIPNPHFDPVTGEFSGDDSFERAMWQMFEERELARERLRAPWESFSEAAAEEATEFGQLKENAPGPKIVGTAGEKTGEILGYAAPYGIPFVGGVTGPLSAGLASIGDTFNQAFEAYKKQGYSDEDAREMARKVAINTGVTTGLIFALPIGRLASLPKSALAQLLLKIGINGAQMSADELQSLLQAKATYNPNLTLGDIAKETGNSFLMGALLSVSLPGAHKATPEELARFGGSPAQGHETPNSIVPLKPPPEPLSAAERQALDKDIQARKPISMDTIVRANIDGDFPLPKGYELDIPNDRLIYAGLGDSNTERDAAGSALTGKPPLKEGEVTTYQDFKNRSVVGDNLEGHEPWQHSNLKSHGLATERLSTDASKQNPVIVLNKETHAKVNAAQRAINASSQTPKQNITDNVEILRKLRAAQDEVIDQIDQISNQHSEKYIKPGTHEPQ